MDDLDEDTDRVSSYEFEAPTKAVSSGSAPRYHAVVAKELSDQQLKHITNVKEVRCLYWPCPGSAHSACLRRSSAPSCRSVRSSGFGWLWCLLPSERGAEEDECVRTKVLSFPTCPPVIE